MKKMRIILAWILVLTLLLAGCSAVDEVDKDRDSDTKETVQIKEEPEETTEAEETTEPEETTEIEETTAPEKTISLGRWEGTKYSNTYLGYGCELDSNWTIYTEEQLRGTTGAVKDMYSETEFSELFNNAEYIMDMQVENPTDLRSMNINYTKLTPVQKLSFMSTTEEQLVDTTLESSDAMIASYEQIGITGAKLEKVTVDFLGEQRYAIHTAAQVSGVDYYVLQLFDYNNGDYYTCLTLASYVTDQTTEMLDIWYSVE